MSVASVKIMHINMQTEMSQDHCLDQAQQVTQHGINHEVQTNTDCHNHLAINHEVQTNTDCHNHLAINQNIDHKKCQECSSLSCQTQISCLHSLQSSLDPLDTFYSIDQPNFYYLNQYLNGYWQEISRPPKT
ncbi:MULTISPECIES: hypothetical protein [Gammaproteobacteria]|uniref:hypothetical protein n=1 Tax=Gammaproteobacteria TaxID=1236 RepID=UPI0002D0D858|nr:MULTISPECIES: hypothetical protein [Gammaproteobacteria]ENW26767.1 hypothetical protein F925_00085 [Acinetobacter lwoffii NCTC 5866 = CIP 64.10 = NIPH 512]MDM1345281.1 hypothetical protein [Acinetobacter pseudolwoffii]